MKEQTVHSGNLAALESLASLAGALFVGSLLAGWFLQRKGHREQNVGVTVFEVFAVFTSLALSGLALYTCVFAFESGEAVDDSVVTGVATLVVMSAVLLALLAVVARFSSLPGGIGMHIPTISVTLFTALSTAVMIFLLSPGSELIVPGATLILVGGAGLGWFFSVIERHGMRGTRKAMQKRVMALSAQGYRRHEATVALGLPESHTGSAPPRLVCWSRQGRSYLDYASCSHLQREARRRWGEFGEGETRAPLASPTLMDIDLSYRFPSWPQKFRLTLSIHREGEKEMEKRVIEANEMRLFEVTGLGLV